jgi:hypothetical protein
MFIAVKYFGRDGLHTGSWSHFSVHGIGISKNPDGGIFAWDNNLILPGSTMPVYLSTNGTILISR